MINPRNTAGERIGQGITGEGAPSPYEDTLARRWEQRRLILTVLATLAGMILAIWLGRSLRSREQNAAIIEFRGSAAQWGAALQRFVTDRMAKVSTTVAFFRGSDINDRNDFHKFVRPLTKSMPAIELLAWAPRIPAARRSAHEEAVRKEGRPKYVISDRDERGRFVAAGKREEYYPILFAEPLSGNESLLGLDLGHDAAGRAAIREATATGHAMVAVHTVSSSANLLSVLEPAHYESVASHLAKRPDDQPETDGFVLTVFRMEVMANKWLNLPEFKIPPNTEIYISANGKALVSRPAGVFPLPFQGTVASAPMHPPVGGTLAKQEFEVGNAVFTVVFVAPARYIAECGSRKPVVALLTGLLLTGLVAGYFWLLTGRMADVERRVADRWLELRERERYIRHLVDNTGDAIFLCDEQGKILDTNWRACESLGYRREQLLSMSLADVEAPVGAADPRPSLSHSVDEYPRTFQTVHLRKDGTTFPVEVHMTLVGIGAQRLLLSIVRDLTDRTQAERLLSNNEQALAGMAQQMTAAMDNLQTAERLLASDPETARQSLNEGMRLLRKAVDTGR